MPSLSACAGWAPRTAPPKTRRRLLEVQESHPREAEKAETGASHSTATWPSPREAWQPRSPKLTGGAQLWTAFSLCDGHAQAWRRVTCAAGVWHPHLLISYAHPGHQLYGTTTCSCVPVFHTTTTRVLNSKILFILRFREFNCIYGRQFVFICYFFSTMVLNSTSLTDWLIIGSNFGASLSSNNMSWLYKLGLNHADI